MDISIILLLLGKGLYRAGLNRVSLPFRNRKKIKVRRRAGVAPQATRGKPSFITLAVDFIRNYSKFYTYISRKLITFTPWNEIDFFKKLIFDRHKDKN